MNVSDIIKNPHNTYLRYREYWNFLLESYEGGVDYTGAYLKTKQSLDVAGFNLTVNGKKLTQRSNHNLFMHPKERTTDYERRIDMSFYYNFCSPVIDIYTNHLFRDSVNEDFRSMERIVEERRENIDEKYSSISEFRKELAESAQVYGHVFVLVDSPMIDTKIFSLQDKQELGVFPYFSIIPPQNVINWSLDKFGRAYWILVVEYSDGNTDPEHFDRDKSMNVSYRLWTRQEWILFDDKGEELMRGTHGLGFVPITPAYNRKSKKCNEFLGISHIADVAFIARDIYNSCSELKQILMDQTFSILAVQGEATDYPETEIGTNKGLVVPRDSQMPQYITPPSGPADTYMKHISNQISRIFQLTKLEGGSASFDGQTAVEQSGVSKAWDFNQTNSELTSKALNMEDAEMRLWQIFSAWEGKEFDGRIQYPRDFSVKNLKQDLDETEQIMRMSISNEFDKEVKKAIVKKRFPRLPEDQWKKIEGEIDNGQLTTSRSIVDRILKNQNATTAVINGGNNGRGTENRAENRTTAVR